MAAPCLDGCLGAGLASRRHASDRRGSNLAVPTTTRACRRSRWQGQREHGASYSLTSKDEVHVGKTGDAEAKFRTRAGFGRNGDARGWALFLQLSQTQVVGHDAPAGG